MFVNLKRICDHLAVEKNIDRAIQLIAINSCPSGNSSRLYIGRFYKELELFKFASFGFETQPGLINSYERKFLPQMMKDSIQLDSVKFIKHNSSYKELFFTATGLEDNQIWRKTVLIPLLPNYFATLSLQIEITDEVHNQEYFDALRSVINLYLALDSKVHHSPRENARIRKEKQSGPRLTERQELILELIQEGKTNATIASLMGYSESLIRQETMVIYRKLGVEGRKDLKIKTPIDVDSADADADVVDD